MRSRYLLPHLKKDLSQKMVFIGGPRQVGKTSLALMLANLTRKSTAYLNWDFDADRLKIMKNEWPRDQQTLVFDEIHKFKRWRNWIKGNFDHFYPDHHFIVTGSARLDHYRKGGDSLVGRYFLSRLHPFSCAELKLTSRTDVEHLLEFGGFPEPFLKGDTTFWRRWARSRISRIVREDVRDLESVRDLSMIELLVEALPSRVGSPLSIQALREDLQVAHETIEKWIRILENLYICYRIPPFGAPKIRAVKKEKKLYLWDWAAVPDPGARFENFVASHLLKFCNYHEDIFGHKMELRYLRDTDGREIDFVIIKDNVPLFAVEAKSGDRSLSPSIRYFKERTKIGKFYQVHLSNRDWGNPGVEGRVLPLLNFCAAEGLV